MRTSLNNIKLIDDYLLGRMPAGDTLLFEANMVLNTDLLSDVEFQQKTLATVRQFGRQQLRAEISAVQQKLTSGQEHRGFMQRIANYFKKH